jgi:hypothetical protein
MAVTTTKTNKPLNPRGNDQSPKGYNRAALYSGKALDFDGVNDYVDLDGFTMAGNVATIVFQAKFSNDGFLLDIDAQRFVVKNTSANGVQVFNSTSWKTYGTTIRSEIGFYAIVSDGTTQRVYYNGHQLGDDVGITAIDWDSITAMKLGSYHAGNSQFFDGQIAGFKIFNTALTAAQVADLYNNPEKVVPTGVADSALKLWLPMMEGAGTTAYDGSGNGNHGTISGATWTHGIGAPVAQTAVIDWNKSSNLFPYSEDLSDSQWDKSATRVTYAVDQTTAPDGRTTADEIIEAATTGDHLVFGSYTTSTYTDYTASIYMKDNTRGFGFVQIAPNAADTTKRYTVVVDLSDGSVTDTAGNSTNASYDVTDAGNGWYRISVTRPHGSGSSVFIVYGLSDSGTPTYDSQFEPTYTGDGTSSLYVWGASLTASSAVTPYVPTFATAQTSEVLLPQGLTTGRDITGVNLFENVRKQGALNLDGNSWAEVHDNASLDITDAITLEAWVWYLEGDSDWAAVSKYQTGATAFMMYIQPARRVNLFANGSSRASSNTDVLTNNAWNHIAITYDKANVRIYINGSEDNSAAYTAALTTTSKVVEIGRYWGSNAYGTDGSKIAQPRIYNRALTAEEVERNYNAGKNIYTN